MMQFSEFLAYDGVSAFCFNSNKRKLKIVAIAFNVPLQKIIIFGVFIDFILMSHKKWENI